MTHPPSTTIDLLQVTTRASTARQIIAGFSLALPALATHWRQIDEALAGIPALATDISRLRAQLTDIRLKRANLAAAGLATLTANRNGEPDPLAYLRDELDAQEFGTGREQR